MFVFEIVGTFSCFFNKGYETLIFNRLILNYLIRNHNHSIAIKIIYIPNLKIKTAITEKLFMG